MGAEGTMAKVFYSLSGEGRGHATRVRALVEGLGRRHDVTLFAYGDAFHLLKEAYSGSAVRVRPIRGMRFRYGGTRLDYLRTGLAGLRFLGGSLGRLVDYLAERIRRERPDLCITDFEPALPRAAARCGVPCASLDHQHLLVVGDLGSLPLRLRGLAALLGLFVQAYTPAPAKTIVSSFYAPPLRKRYRSGTVRVGVLLRPEVLRAQPRREGHLTAYFRRPIPETVLLTLSRSPLPVRVYGLGLRPPSGAVRFFPVGLRGFLQDLASAEALVSTAGNQLVGEALYLGKPVLALPEPGNVEQSVNAHFLKISGCGEFVEARDFDLPRFHDFLASLDRFRRSIVPERVAGNAEALRALAPLLGEGPESGLSGTGVGGPCPGGEGPHGAPWMEVPSAPPPRSGAGGNREGRCGAS